MTRVRVGCWYVYNANLLEIAHPQEPFIEDGTIVKVKNLHGCPPANTMGHCYVFNTSGEFLRLVSCGALTLLSKVDKRLARRVAKYGV